MNNILERQYLCSICDKTYSTDREANICKAKGFNSIITVGSVVTMPNQKDDPVLSSNNLNWISGPPISTYVKGERITYVTPFYLCIYVAQSKEDRHEPEYVLVSYYNKFTTRDKEGKEETTPFTPVWIDQNEILGSSDNYYKPRIVSIIPEELASEILKLKSNRIPVSSLAYDIDFKPNEYIE